MMLPGKGQRMSAIQSTPLKERSDEVGAKRGQIRLPKSRLIRFRKMGTGARRGTRITAPSFGERDRTEWAIAFLLRAKNNGQGVATNFEQKATLPRSSPSSDAGGFKDPDVEFPAGANDPPQDRVSKASPGSANRELRTSALDAS